MAGAAALKAGKGFGTWLIPVIILSIFGSVAIFSLIAFVCVHFCRTRRRITDQEPELTHEIYRMPTIPYKDPSADRPVDTTIGRLITHSRSLHVVRPFIHVLNHRALISDSHATNRPTGIVSVPKSVLQNYAIPLNLRHIRIELCHHPSSTVTHDHTDKYTWTILLT